MKAMISDRAARGWMHYQGDEGAAEAILEAQAILVASEPETQVVAYPIHCLSYAKGFSAASGSALAESLAAFCERSL